MTLPSIKAVVDQLAGKPPKWDTTVQTPDEARRMRAYVRFAERNAGGPVSGMCGTCAFRPGTEANGSARVLEMIEQTALLGGMFNCHHGGQIDDVTGCIHDSDALVRPCAGFIAFRDGRTTGFLAPADTGRTP